ncbi:MAG: hypothetical protein ACYSO3_02905 [Planctomycetota bacterium]
MKVLLILISWAILLALCWPLAVLALVLWPVVWLLSIPFRFLIKSILFLPARVLGYRSGS